MPGTAPEAPARRRLTPAVVVEAACGLADDVGIDAVSLSAVARRLGVQTPSLYNHVSSLGGLRRGIALRALQDLDRVLRDATVGQAHADALRAMATAYRAFARAHPGRYAATQRVDFADDDELRAAASRTTEVVFAILAGWGYDGDDLVHVTRAVRSALHGFVTLELDAGFGLELDRDESFARMVELLIRAAGRDV